MPTDAHFHPTRWTLVLRACGVGAEAGLRPDGQTQILVWASHILKKILQITVRKNRFARSIPKGSAFFHINRYRHLSSRLFWLWFALDKDILTALDPCHDGGDAVLQVSQCDCLHTRIIP